MNKFMLGLLVRIESPLTMLASANTAAFVAHHGAFILSGFPYSIDKAMRDIANRRLTLKFENV